MLRYAGSVARAELQAQPGADQPDPSTPGPGCPVLLVDTYSLFFRAHHALPRMNTRAGAPTSALYGFSAALIKELRERQPRGLAFAIDAPERTFRHQQYAGYKATREAVPSALRAQFGRLHELLDAFGVPRFQVPGVEADDVLATLARKLRESGVPALILSGDRDLLQVVQPGVWVLFVGARGHKPMLYDEARVRARFGVRPEQLPELMALVGDASDNLPGVAGVGPRTAAKWLDEQGSLGAVLEHIPELRPARLGPALLLRREQVRQNHELATLRSDVELPPGPLFAAVAPAALQRVGELFSELEFKSLVPRLAALAATT